MDSRSHWEPPVSVLDALFLVDGADAKRVTDSGAERWQEKLRGGDSDKEGVASIASWSGF